MLWGDREAGPKECQDGWNLMQGNKNPWIFEVCESIEIWTCRFSSQKIQQLHNAKDDFQEMAQSRPKSNSDCEFFVLVYIPMKYIFICGCNMTICVKIVWGTIKK